MLVVVSSEGIRGILQDTMAYLASYPSLFLAFVLFGFGVAVASSILHYRFNAAKKDAIVPTCYDCEQQSKKTTKKNKRALAENVGILGMEVYFPANYIDQADLEQYDGVSAGKYTKGLAQEKMCFTGDREDVNSIALTAVKNLLEKYDIHPSQIGRLEVGTETMVDACKSTKTVLMDLFHEHGNYDLEGVTSVNACYGGTAALFNSVAWVESRAWDGRYALVVCGDIAVYAKGPARPTCGCGAVAMLIGPNAPLVMESELRTTFSENMWDFYKPDPHSEYPTVDGKFSQSCYLKTLDDCYRRFCIKNEHAGVTKNGKYFDVSANDYVIFHSPYNKLAQKGFSRIIFNDFLRNPTLPQYEPLKKWHGASLEDTYYDRDLDAASRKVSLDMWNRMVEPSCFASRAIGNCYTASVYINLACLIDTARTQLHGKRIMLFSYGSGAVGSIFSFRVPRPSERQPLDNGAVPFTVERMSESLNLVRRLETRMKRTPEEFNAHLDLREKSHGLKSYKPLQSIDTLFPGTYYLVEIDDKHRRKYARKPMNQSVKYAALPAIIEVPDSPKNAVAQSTPSPAPVSVIVSG
ncbi:hydroxymethylglutaryl-CoA synthase, partial [Thraustotheca clavata]